MTQQDETERNERETEESREFREMTQSVGFSKAVLIWSLSGKLLREHLNGSELFYELRQLIDSPLANDELRLMAYERMQELAGSFDEGLMVYRLGSEGPLASARGRDAGWRVMSLTGTARQLLNVLNSHDRALFIDTNLIESIEARAGTTDEWLQLAALATQEEDRTRFVERGLAAAAQAPDIDSISRLVDYPSLAPYRSQMSLRAAVLAKELPDWLRVWNISVEGGEIRTLAEQKIELLTRRLIDHCTVCKMTESGTFLHLWSLRTIMQSEEQSYSLWLRLWEDTVKNSHDSELIRAVIDRMLLSAQTFADWSILYNKDELRQNDPDRLRILDGMAETADTFHSCKILFKRVIQDEDRSAQVLELMARIGTRQEWIDLLNDGSITRNKRIDEQAILSIAAFERPAAPETDATTDEFAVAFENQ